MDVSLIHLIVSLVLIGVFLWAIEQFPMDATIRKLIQVVVVVVVVLWLLGFLGMVSLARFR